jgi:deoxyadenosine/deoxycytidine kinase
VVYYSFAGNIGVGKSTLAAAIATRVGLPLLEESVGDNPFLEDFYEDPAAGAFKLQMFNVASRSTAILNASAEGDVVLDRSFEEDLVYVDAAHEIGWTGPREYAIYKGLYDLARRVLPVPTRLFYLRTDDLVELRARIARRDRPSERFITVDYLADLQRRYDQWYDTYEGPKNLVDVTRVHPLDLASEITLGL